MDPSSASAANENKKKKASSDEAEKVQHVAKRSRSGAFSVPTGYYPSYVSCSKEKEAGSAPTDEDSIEKLNHFCTKIWPKFEPIFRHLTRNGAQEMIQHKVDSLSRSQRYDHSNVSYTKEDQDGFAPIDEDSIKELKHFCTEIWPKLQPILHHMTRNGAEEMIQHKVDSLSPTQRPSQSKEHESGKEVTTASGSGTLKFKLYFLNPINPIMYDNEEIKSENGEALEVAICDITNGYTIIYTGSLSSAPVDFFILDGQINSNKRRTPWTSSDFNESILTSREDKPSSLISVKNNQFYLKCGVCSVKNLVVTDNSCWTKFKTFCLGAKITAENVLHEFGMIGEAVSEPFNVYDKRGKGTKKHHPPSEKDEVWRLDRIKKDGPIHKKLSLFKEISEDGIQNVGEFREALHQKGRTALKMYLGMTNSEKTWNQIESHLMEGVVDVPTNYDPTFQANFHFMETGQGNFNQNVEFIQENQNFQTIGELGPNSNVNNDLPEDLRSQLNVDIPPSPLGHMKLGA